MKNDITVKLTPHEKYLLVYALEGILQEMNDAIAELITDNKQDELFDTLSVINVVQNLQTKIEMSDIRF